MSRYQIKWTTQYVGRNHPWGTLTLTVADRTLTVVQRGRNDEGRVTYTWTLNATDGKTVPVTIKEDDVYGGVDAPIDLVKGAATVLSFLGAAAESYGHAMRNRVLLADTENGTLFSLFLTEWAYQNADEIAVAAYELESEDSDAETAEQDWARENEVAADAANDRAISEHYAYLTSRGIDV